MAAITPTEGQMKKLRTFDDGQEETVTNAHSATRQFKVYHIDPSTGRAVPSIATSLANVGAAADRGTIIGIVTTPPDTNLAVESVTLMREGDIFLGIGVLDTLDFGDPVYLSNASAGGLDTAAPATNGHVVVQIGHVVPFARESGIDKGLQVSTRDFARVGSIEVVSV